MKNTFLALLATTALFTAPPVFAAGKGAHMPGLGAHGEERAPTRFVNQGQLDEAAQAAEEFKKASDKALAALTAVLRGTTVDPSESLRQENAHLEERGRRLGSECAAMSGRLSALESIERGHLQLQQRFLAKEEEDRRTIQTLRAQVTSLETKQTELMSSLAMRDRMEVFSSQRSQLGQAPAQGTYTAPTPRYDPLAAPLRAPAAAASAVTPTPAGQQMFFNPETGQLTRR